MVDRNEAEAMLCVAAGGPPLGPHVLFRPGQWEAIDHLVNRRGRALVVQRTGWGKSMVYFIAAALLRQQKAGPTIIISPLLALMRNQIEAAQRLGLHATTINSSNTAEWSQAKRDLLNDKVDVLLISPERLANDEFVETTLLPIAESVALLVVDEAHCISDWGHDFRPDYRRIISVLKQLPRNVAVLATTATANKRVIADIQAQLGDKLSIQRGPLVRDSLALQNIVHPTPAARLAWLVDYIPRLPGSGIVYALTKRDCERVAAWLHSHGIRTAAYYSGATALGYPDTNTYREELERQLLNNEVKCLVATTALGMGYDKPDLGFVIHYQAPGSVVLYYQQVGRAGRAIDRAYGILLSGKEDSDINQFFRDTAFPPEQRIKEILGTLESFENGATLSQLQKEVNLRPSDIADVLKLLVVETRAPLLRDGSKWFRTPNPFTLDRDRIEHLTNQRSLEWAEMQVYLESRSCLMEFLEKALDDDTAHPCGRCSYCVGKPLFSAEVNEALLIEAQRFVRQSEMPLPPRQKWPPGGLAVYRWRGNIPDGLKGEVGRTLSVWGQPVWGASVKAGKEAGSFSIGLVNAVREMVQERWPEAARATWVTCVPSLRHPELVPLFAERVANALGLPFWPVVQKRRETSPQKDMQNTQFQCKNLDGAFSIRRNGEDISGPVLLVDDAVDSRWTMTVIAALLRQAGSGPVYPVALASTGPD